MDNNQYNQQLSDMIAKNIATAESMSKLLLSPEYEESILKNLTPEQKEQFLKAKEGSNYQKGTNELNTQLANLKAMKDKMK